MCCPPYYRAKTSLLFLKKPSSLNIIPYIDILNTKKLSFILQKERKLDQIPLGSKIRSSSLKRGPSAVTRWRGGRGRGRGKPGLRKAY